MARSDFEAFVASQILSTRRLPSRAVPPLQRCLVVKAVAATSPAGRAGIVPGDLLVSLNGHAAGTLDPKLYRTPARQRTYLFSCPQSHERVELEATGIDPGVELARTVESIVAGYKPETFDPEQLLELWEARAWPALEKLAGQALAARRDRDTPALLLLGAALFEQARFEQGYALIVEYVRDFIRHWTQSFSAVAIYYVAMRRRMDGDKTGALELLREAFQKAAFDRFAEALVSLGDPRPTTPTFWLDRPFPTDYKLPTIEGEKREVSYAEGQAGLADGHLFLVCLLDGYRGNGPYNDFMWRYSEFAAHFRPYVTKLHVITERAARLPDRAYFHVWEDKARAASLPFEVLFDEPGAVGQALAPPGSPYVVALDKRGVVLAERDLEGVELWKALEAANAV